MDINDFKTKLARLSSEFGNLPGHIPRDKTTAFFHLSEEIGEVGEQLRHEIQNSPSFSKEKLGSELADVISFATIIAHYFNINVSQALQENLDKVQSLINKEKP